MASDDGFFSRWSRRKVDVREGRRLDDPPPAAVKVAAPVAATPAGQSSESETSKPEPIGPTLADVQQLTPESDFTGFMARGVAPDVKNAAMKKLFADPHFNVMDRMDIYIDDYGQPDPLPVGMLQKMRSAQFMQLVPPEPAEKPAAGQGGEDAHPTPEPNVAQSEPRDGEAPSAEPPPLIAESPRDNPHLRLQPDPAAEPQGLGPKPE